jgi:hypothetical protein
VRIEHIAQNATTLATIIPYTQEKYLAKVGGKSAKRFKKLYMTYIIYFGFQERILDIPGRSQESQNKGQEFQLSSHFEFIR